MNAEEYTERVEALVNEAIDRLKEAASLMRERGDDVRPMDLDEAVMYAESAINRN